MQTLAPIDLHEVWQQALAELQLQASRQDFRAWYADTRLLAYDGATCVVGAENPFTVEWLTRKCSGTVGRTLQCLLGKPVELEFIVRPPDPPTSPPPPLTLDPPPAEKARRTRRPPASAAWLPLSPRFTFNNFVVGPGNRLAHAASVAVAERPGLAYNPLFIYGGAGLGKTHLLHAIGHAAIAQDREAIYVSSEAFINEFIESLSRGRMEEFRNKYRRADMLLVDDVQFLAGKEQTQEEFFHTFNAIYEANGQIVLSSDRHPKTIATLAKRLQSRFVGGLMADIQEPDLETRAAILRAKLAQREGACPVPDSVLDLIAQHVPSNVRELEGALNRVLAQAQCLGLPVTLDAARQALQPSADPVGTGPVSPDLLLKAVCRIMEVARRELQGPRRDRQTVQARQIAMYLLREHTGLSLSEIGGLLGGRDHTTVLHGWEKVTQALPRDARLRETVASVRRQLAPRS